MSTLTEVQKRLADGGAGTYEVDVKRGRMPDSPDVMCTVQPYPGLDPVYGFGTAEIQEETPAIQVLFRGEPHDMDGPLARAQAAFEDVAKVQAQTLTGGGTSAFYHHIHPRQSPFELKRDAKERVYIAFNILCEKEPSA